MKRYGGTVDFKRKWVEFENGFGNINGDFWFGKWVFFSFIEI